MKHIFEGVPFLSSIASRISRLWLRPSSQFTDSEKYWKDRYASGGNSGDGSYGALSKFKAGIINEFVIQHDVKTILEYGSGDGNQLLLAKYPTYVGFDVSPKAISICKKLFDGDSTKAFKLLDDYSNEKADLTLSLDVLYHLIEDEVFHGYMDRLFDSAERFVVIYASDTDENKKDQAPHVKHRNFTKWVELMKPRWSLIKHIPNKHPFSQNANAGSFADFFIYEKK